MDVPGDFAVVQHAARQEKMSASMSGSANAGK
jgi:hypothetical protein